MRRDTALLATLLLATGARADPSVVPSHEPDRAAIRDAFDSGPAIGYASPLAYVASLKSALAREAGRLSEAVSELSTALLFDPDSKQLLRKMDALFQASLEQRELSAALAASETLLRYRLDDVRPVLAVARQALARSEHDIAARALRAALGARPGLPIAYFGLGEIAAREGRRGEAVAVSMQAFVTDDERSDDVSFWDALSRLRADRSAAAWQTASNAATPRLRYLLARTSAYFGEGARAAALFAAVPADSPLAACARSMERRAGWARLREASGVTPPACRIAAEREADRRFAEAAALAGREDEASARGRRLGSW